ncbi:rhodanese-like domain-containing protein [Sphingobacterium corticis]|uniref:Rhodanese-like domain-containing protein n=1 Tax=Sphingobacterium corticis TaxID=1812823 RepID=A0ABW5NIA3_9SPHI
MKRKLFLQKSLSVFGLVLINGVVSSCKNSSKEQANKLYTVKQFVDEGLAQFSYALEAEGKIVLIDPTRNPSNYYAYATTQNSKIIAVVETHTHADFVSAHRQVHEEQHVPIYISKYAKATYPHEVFDDNDTLKLTDHVSLRAINTPGHSQDSISVLLEVDGKVEVIFTGDGLLLGGVGRPDLRESDGEFSVQREQLAKQLYQTIRTKYNELEDNIVVYPGHGAGSLCGQSLSDAKESTIGYEKANNPAFQYKSEREFVDFLLKDPLTIPAYFPFAIEVNRRGADNLENSITKIPAITAIPDQSNADIVVDTRSSDDFRKAHIKGALNIPIRNKWETWLGTIVHPEEKFYLIVENEKSVETTLETISKIGYETLVKGVIVHNPVNAVKSLDFNQDDFDHNRSTYQILDVRTKEEAQAKPIFNETDVIPLQKLREQISSLDADKPIVIHCASGYRSAIATSLIQRYLPKATVIDMGNKIKKYTPTEK